MNEQAIISEWLKIAGKVEPEDFQMPDDDKFKLGIRLILEELTEVVHSNPKMIHWYADELTELSKELSKLDSQDLNYLPNKHEFMDGCVDLRYMLGNMIHFSGGIKEYEEYFKLITKSNFSKFCTSEEEAIESVNAYKSKGVETYYKKVNDYFVVYRSEDHKILKSINYKSVAELLKESIGINEKEEIKKETKES